MSSSSLPETSSPPRRRTARRVWFALALLVAGGAGIAAWSLLREPALPVGVSLQEYEQAARQFHEVYRREPNRIEALSLLAELSVAEDRLETAAACFGAIPTADDQYGLSARLQESQVLIRLDRARDAERSLREFLSHAKTDATVPRSHLVTARTWLAYLLSVELRVEERRRVLAELHASGHADVYDSKQYHFPTLLIWHSSTGRHRLVQFLEQDSDDLMLQTAYGRYLTTDGMLDESRTLLETLHREHPSDLAVTAALLECLYEQADLDSFAQVAKTLPKHRDDEPWLLTRMRGEFALEEQRWDDAVSHFQNVLTKDPADPACHMGLARAYAGLKNNAARDEVLQRSSVLADIRVRLVGLTEEDADASRKLAETCENMGLTAAAKTFRRHSERIAQPDRRPGRTTAVPL
ncbi:MAG: tetratricopeptide repeat protein [Planctomycetaceae bacterium]